MNREAELKRLRRRIQLMLNDYPSTTVVAAVVGALYHDEDGEERQFARELDVVLHLAVDRRGKA